MKPEDHLTENTVALSAKGHALSADELASYMLNGDCTKLNAYARARLLVALATHVGLDPLERPFMIIEDKKSAVIYARAACADGLCRERGITTELIGGVEEIRVGGSDQLIARARATVMTSGRCRDAVGAVPIMQQGEVSEWGTASSGKKYPKVWDWRPPTPTEASNMYMKVTTKAQRRAVLGLVGLGGIRDETEMAEPIGQAVEYHAVPEEDGSEGEVIDASYTVEDDERPPDPPHSDEAGA